MSDPTLLRNLAYYRTGGRVKHLFQPKTLDQLQDAMRVIREQKLPYYFLGGGTNSLVMDDDWPGAVVSFGQMIEMGVDEAHRMTVGAGVINSDAAEAAYQRGLAGIAWMFRLPGQLGGTVRMNARCYGGEISEVVEQVVTVDQTGRVRHYNDATVFRGYKDTVFMTNGEAIAQVTLRLAPGDRAAIREKMDFCKSDRESKGQFVHPTCGCVFKNDYSVRVPSGMLLERAGIKSLKHKGTEINPYHANFVYNVAATSRAILETTLLMRQRVYEEFGVWMEYEMEILGELPADLKEQVREKRPHQFNMAKLEVLRREFGGHSSP